MPRRILDTPSFWINAPRPLEDRPVLWVGAGTRDTGFSLTRLSFQITHATDADTNEERDFIIAALQQCGVVANVRSYRPSDCLSIGRVNRYATDGFVAAAELTPPAASA